MKKGYKECPFCKNEIKKGAIKCMYCKEMLTEIEETKNKQKTKICPFCKNEIKFEAKKCQYCQEFLNDTKEIKENTEENETKNEDTPIIDDFSKYKETGNRLSRKTFFIHSILCNLITIILIVVLQSFGHFDTFIYLIILANIGYHTYITTKRFHDFGRSGRFALPCFFSPIIIPVLYFIKGDNDINKYGPATIKYKKSKKKISKNFEIFLKVLIILLGTGGFLICIIGLIAPIIMYIGVEEKQALECPKGYIINEESGKCEKENNTKDIDINIDSYKGCTQAGGTRYEENKICILPYE